MRNDINNEDTKIILTEMLKRVGEDYDTFDFSDPVWFQKHSWTMEQEDDFRVWLGKFLVQKKYVGKGKKRGVNWGYYEAGKIVGNYGWKLLIQSIPVADTH